MKNKLKNIAYVIGLFIMITGACKEVDPVIEELEFDRVFTPVNVTAIIRNMTTAELNWSVRGDADHYVVEFSEDSLVFGSIVRTVEVAPEQLPFRIALDGQTRYSARVKGVSGDGVADSKWGTVTFKTDAENIFAPLEGADIGATSVTLKWPAGSEVTNFIITPGGASRAITAQEIAAGSATITGLTGETNYTVLLMKGTKQRGSVTFKTLIDIGDATAVYPEDDLNAMIASAAEGDVLVLFPGEYLAYTGKITINKSISVKGFYPHNKPILHVQFVLENGVQNVEVRDVDMDGTYIDPATSLEVQLDHAFQYATTGTAYGSLSINSSNIHDYGKSLVSGASPNVASSVESISVTDCVVTNILTISADFIDFRAGHVANLSLKNSTFANCAPTRDFIRLDNSSTAFPGRTTNVVIDQCTLYKVSTGTSNRLLYVRFVNNSLKVSNTIIAETGGSFSNQALTSQPECSKNNYFNAALYYSGASPIKVDISGTYTTLDPGFVNAANGNFTVTNQTLIDTNIGDPRW